MSREESRQRLHQTNAICDKFEDAWQAGAQPSIEEFIPSNIDEKGEKQLIHELLELDQHLRKERGISATYHTLIEKYPWVGDAVATLLGDSVVEGDTSTLLSGAAKPQGLLTAREPPGADGDRASNFLPGQLISERYRIVQLLGRGGMGDVYQADDIRLGQQVALKFLSSKLAESSELLQYLYDEVRLSQKLAHPHICRVHDLVVHQRLHFISMAYIEGETLHELLRRIGPLRFSKAIQLTQQICLGLSAAHQAGVLHRDLKPANIMVDNRGCAIIADFGLAREGPLENKDEGLVGTPIYMAPEQLSKNTTSVQSDIYALGLIMYEMFTGRRMYRGSLEELASIHDSSVASDAVQNSPEIPPAVATTISACLAREPSDRPRSVGTVLRMLPVEEGQEVALTTEETPSPGMLAATPDSLQISQGKSYALVGLISILLLAATLLSSRTFARFGDLRARAYLAERSAEIVRAFQGENGRASYSAFVANRPALKWRLTGGEFNSFHEHESAAYFWYRESPVGLAPLVPDWTGDAFLTVDEQRPTAHLPGSVHLRLDTIGNLRYLTSIPADLPDGAEAAIAPEQVSAAGESEVESEPTGPELEFDGWELALGFVGLQKEDVAKCKEVEPDFVPPRFADERRSYVLEGEEEPGSEIQINIARSGNSISYVHVLTPWTAEATHVAEGMAGSSILALLRIVWIPLLVIAALWVARRNVFARRADRVGASRIAVCCALIFWIRWLLSGTHVSSALEMDLLFSALAGGCLLSGMLWCTYVAFEPIVRRYWPSTLVSWSRVIQGRIVDPLVGRDLLIGVAAGLLAVLGKLLIIELPNLFGLDSYGLPNIYNFAPLGGLRLAIGEVLEAFNKALAYSLFFQLLFLVSLRLTLKNTYLATAVFVLFLSISVTVQYEPKSVAFVISAIEMLMTAVILMKFGVLPAATMHFVRLLMKFPVSVSPSIWYAEYGAIAIVVVIALTGFAFFCLQSGGSRNQSQSGTGSLFPHGAS